MPRRLLGLLVVGALAGCAATGSPGAPGTPPAPTPTPKPLHKDAMPPPTATPGDPGLQDPTVWTEPVIAAGVALAPTETVVIDGVTVDALYSDPADDRDEIHVCVRNFIDRLRQPYIGRYRLFHLRVEIAPPGGSVTDMPDFKEFAGVTAGATGLPYDQSGGITDYPRRAPDGVLYNAVALSEGALSGCTAGPGEVIAHELGHTVDNSTLTQAQMDGLVQSWYQLHSGAPDHLVSAYSGSNEFEFFAEDTVAWLGQTCVDSLGSCSANTIRKYDPDTAKLLMAVFGVPPERPLQ